MPNSNTKKDWKQTTLGEVAEIIGGGTPSTKEASYWGGDIPWITPKDLSGYNSRWIERGEKNITKSGFEKSSARMFPVGSILFSSRAPIGYIAINSVPVTTNQGFKSLIPKKCASHMFLYYWLLQNKTNIEKQASGSTFAEISGAVMKAILILLPPLPEQKSIAAVLSSFDDKIELLRAQNKTLEEIAQRLFKEWFVDFNFPNENGKPYKKSGGKMIESELGEIPEGWRVKTLADIADFLNGVALQKFPATDGSCYLPVIKIRELKQGITAQTDKASTNLDVKYVIEDGDVLFSWSGSLEVVIWKYGKGALNQHLFKVSSEVYPKWFYYFWLLRHLEGFRSLAAAKATTMGHIQRHHLDEALVSIPNENYVNKANNVFEPILQKIILNNSKIQTLATLRDTLLPQLMCGGVEAISF